MNVTPVVRPGAATGWWSGTRVLTSPLFTRAHQPAGQASHIRLFPLPFSRYLFQTLFLPLRSLSSSVLPIRPWVGSTLQKRRPHGLSPDTSPTSAAGACRCLPPRPAPARCRLALLTAFPRCPASQAPLDGLPQPVCSPPRALLSVGSVSRRRALLLPSAASA